MISYWEETIEYVMPYLYFLVLTNRILFYLTVSSKELSLGHAIAVAVVGVCNSEVTVALHGLWGHALGHGRHDVIFLN